MKFVSPQIMYFLQNREARRNFRLLALFVVMLCVMIVAYSVVFHALMEYEGQKHSWLTGLYWTLTVMSTLGFGDITFRSDPGRFFSLVVLASGVLFLLVLLPFAFIQFFLAPWLEAQSRARAPRQLPNHTTGHVLITSFDPVSENLIKLLKQYQVKYAVIVNDLKRALELHDQGIKVVLGDLDDLNTYKRCQVDEAALVVATGNDMVNTSITLTVRELSTKVPIIADVDSADSVDILRLAGSTHVFMFKVMLGRYLARRSIGLTSRVNVVGHFGDLHVAEASATRSPLVGKTIAETRLRETTGVTVVGLWERGHFYPAHATSLITSATVLVLAGTVEQLEAYDMLFCVYVANDAPVIIIGGGRVGAAVGLALEEREMDYRIIEKNPRVAVTEKHVLGSAADLETLERAGLREALTAIVTTSDDDINVYLTVYCRKLCPDMQIISRANFEKNISTLHRAGADFVMSYASMGANAILNVLQGEELLMFAEGLNVFRIAVPPALQGKPLRDSRLREDSGCNVIAIETAGHATVNPDPAQVMGEQDELILIGNAEGERKLLKQYPGARREKTINVAG